MEVYFLYQVTRKNGKFKKYLKTFEARGLDDAAEKIEILIKSGKLEGAGNLKYFNESILTALKGRRPEPRELGIYNLDTYPYKQIEVIEKITHLIIDTKAKDYIFKCSRLLDTQLSL